MTWLRAASRLLTRLDANFYSTDPTGEFWGTAGVGGLFYARSTGRVLVQKRSEHVNEPNTWGVWGGAIDAGESLIPALAREVREETGYLGKPEYKRVWVYENGDFRFTNFLIVIDEEFTPKLSWESSDYRWVDISDIPSPVHFGLKAALPHYKRAVNREQVRQRRLRRPRGGLSGSRTNDSEYERIDVSGVPVTLHELQDGDDLEPYLKGVRKAIDIVKRSPFRAALRDLRIDIGPPGMGVIFQGTEGAYDFENDTLWLFPSSSPSRMKAQGVLLHELGHRFYFKRISPRARRIWSQTIIDKITRVGEEAIRRWYGDDASKKQPPKISDEMADFRTRKLSEAADEATRAQYEAISRFHKRLNRDNGIAVSPAVGLAAAISKLAGKPVMIEGMTDYGATSPEEAFAEAFRLYLERGPGRLGPWTRQFFQDISRVGGAVFASNSISARDIGRRIPKRFYVVVPIGEEHPRDKKATEDISKGVLDGVQGISDTASIIMQWYGIGRDAILSMDSKKLLEMNSLSRVQYTNPEYLVSDGMRALYRIWDKKTGGLGDYGVANNLVQYVKGGSKLSHLHGVREIRKALAKSTKNARSAAERLKKAVEDIDEDYRSSILSELNYLSPHDAESTASWVEKAVERVQVYDDYDDDSFDKYALSGIEHAVEGPVSRIPERVEDWLSGEERAWQSVDYYADDHPELVEQLEELIAALRALKGSVEELVSIPDRIRENHGKAKDISYLASMIDTGEVTKIIADYLSRSREDVKTVKGLSSRLRREILSSREITDSRRERLASYPLSVWTEMFRRGLERVGAIYGDEGEWLVKDRKLRVPRGSILYITDPLTPQLSRKRARGELTEAEKFAHRYDLAKADEYDRLIEKYKLARRYKIKRLSAEKMEAARNRWYLRDQRRGGK